MEASPFEVVEVSTRGDQHPDKPLHRAGGVGVFVKGLEAALLNHEIDLAVHSLKDLPSKLPPDVALGAIPERGDPRDAFVSDTGVGLMSIPTGARLGTGSPRRRAQILSLRPDLEVVGIRGNVDTRLEKLKNIEYDALVLAAAGLIRLGREEAITEILSPELLLPAAGQGALGVELRADDERIRSLVQAINHSVSWAAGTAERAFMARLGAGCHVPSAAFALVDDDQLWLRGLVADSKGQTILRGERRGAQADAEIVGKALAEDLVARGAAALLNGAQE